MKRVKTFVVSTLAALLCAGGIAHAQSPLIPNGTFEATDGWQFKDGASRETEEGNSFLRLKSTEPGKTVMVYRLVPIEPGTKALELKFKVRYDDIKPGKQKWFDGRIMMNFKDAEGKEVGKGPAPNFKGTSKKGWEDRPTAFLVPEGTKNLEMMFTLFQVESGTIDFDDISLTAVDDAPIRAAAEAAAQKKAEDQARRAAAVKPKVAVPTAEQLPKELKVVGNKIINADGKEIWLQGLSIPSLEWSASGDNILKSVEVATKEWKANCIRLPVREHFWAGTGPYQADGGAGYRQIIDDAINLAATNGAYMVIDLHCYRAPQQKDADFWKIVAEKYKNHPAVMFELLNEPHDISWEVWLRGGPVTDQKKAAEAKKKGEPLAENSEKLVAFQSIGMQKLMDTIRDTGAKNIVIAGGLDWGYDLSGIEKGFALDQRGGNGLVYSSHVYPWKSDWQGKFMMMADKYPLFIGELGGEPERMPFIPPERHEDPYTWVPDMLGLIQKHKLHWTGWCFHPKASPRVILDWDYTPTPFWGDFVKRALAGEQFEMKKMR